MSELYQFFELFATFAEGFIILTVIGNMCEKRYSKGRNLISTLLFTVVYTVIITIMNQVQLFTFATITVAILFSLGVNFILHKGNIPLRLSSTMLTWFFMHSFEYVITYSIVVFAGMRSSISEGFMLIFTGGTTRIVMIVGCKLTELVLCFALRRLCAGIRSLSNKNLMMIFFASLGSFVVMNVLMGLILSESLVVMQVTTIFATFFIVVSIVSTVVAISVNTRYEKEKRETALMAMTNTMMEKNFAELQNSQSAIRQQVHDFKNHIRTISGMIEKDEGAKAYIDELLSVSYEQAQFCNCGNKVIDSIINCKIMEAKPLDVPFEHRVILRTPLHLSSVDICAVLANQIDNAIEACSKVPEGEDRFVTTEIWQKESFVFFKVTNTCIENPFNARKELKSTKEDPSGMHGFGIKNISRTVERYGGTLKNEYKNGCFTSVAMIPNNE